MSGQVSINDCKFVALRGKQQPVHEAPPGRDYCKRHEKTVAQREIKSVVDQAQADRKRRETALSLKRQAAEQLLLQAHYEQELAREEAVVDLQFQAAVRAASRPNSARPNSARPAERADGYFYDSADDGSLLSVEISRGSSSASSHRSSVVYAPMVPTPVNNELVRRLGGLFDNMRV
eukprot:TRINITY_DN9904_c0_g1_i2.p1 TRINITY_DN9904_c0_g1~~TRINITY_DN9904_c0_g1_i2.p1  ORF type:complete len:177 (-),score=26.00 TRINITY_DN9904_c0_g1_i2:273-803(-)